MNIGVPKEIKDNEKRVSLTPSGAHELVQLGNNINIQEDEYEDVEVPTQLLIINNNSNIEIYNKDEDKLCVICQENINKNDIIRKLECDHIYHQKCCDKWLELNKK